MLQRNASGSPLHVMAWPTDDDPTREPFVKGPGETVDFPELLAGFVAVDDVPAEPEQQNVEPVPDPAPELEPVVVEDSPAPAVDEEEGEQL